jgi:hypothetical protein
MTHAMTIQLPATVYDPLVAAAQRNGETPEALAVELLTVMTKDLEAEPLEKHIGAHPGAVADSDDQRDKHLANMAVNAAAPGDRTLIDELLAEPLHLSGFHPLSRDEAHAR